MKLDRMKPLGLCPATGWQAAIVNLPRRESDSRNALATPLLLLPVAVWVLIEDRRDGEEYGYGSVIGLVDEAGMLSEPEHLLEYVCTTDAGYDDRVQSLREQAHAQVRAQARELVGNAS